MRFCCFVTKCDCCNPTVDCSGNNPNQRVNTNMTEIVYKSEQIHLRTNLTAHSHVIHIKRFVIPIKMSGNVELTLQLTTVMKIRLEKRNLCEDANTFFAISHLCIWLLSKHIRV